MLLPNKKFFDTIKEQNKKYRLIPFRIKDIAKSLNLPEKYLQSFGDNIAKIDSEKLKIKNKKKSKLILMTAITPTPAGEGKTTTSVGLTDGLCKIGKK